MWKLNNWCCRSAGTTDNNKISSCRRHSRAKIHRRLFAVFKNETVSHSRMLKWKWCSHFSQQASVSQQWWPCMWAAFCWQQQNTLKLHSDWQTCNRSHEIAAELSLDIGSVESSDNFEVSAWRKIITSAAELLWLTLGIYAT